MPYGVSTTYIKSNINLIRRILSVLSLLLFVAVVALCSGVVYNHFNKQGIEFSESDLFRFVLSETNGEVTLVEFYDYESKTCSVPASVEYGGKIYPVTVIGANAFINHRALEEIEIPASVTHIMGDVEAKKGAFAGCLSLKSITFNDELVHIGAYAFKNCLALESITIPAKTEVQQGAFESCLGLQAIKLDGKDINLDDGCFFNCINVETLSLGDEVILTDKTKKALSDLTGLASFVVSDSNPNYYLDNINQCLVIKNNAKSEMVLAGVKSTVPASTTIISDWVWGRRLVANLYVPSTVTNIEKTAFSADQVIYTDAMTEPAEWLTTSDVICNARQCIFKNEGESVVACVYELDGETKYPEPVDLFPEFVPSTPFIEWELEAENTYEACYVDKAKGNSLKGTNLSSEVVRAKPYIDNITEVSVLFDFNFWEKYKSLCYQAIALQDTQNLSNPYENVYDYLVDWYSVELEEMTDIVKDIIKGESSGTAHLVPEEWSSLQTLVSYIDESFDDKDLLKSNAENVLNEFNAALREAKNVLRGVTDETVYDSTYYKNLRKSFESLTVNVNTDGLLGRVIVACEKLQRANYTKQSWDNLQTCLQAAYAISEHNLSISVVRKELEEAYAALEEIGLEQSLVTFGTWLSICSDLEDSDYKNKEKYDQLSIYLEDLVKTEANINKIIISSEKMHTASSDLEDLYWQLEFAEVSHKEPNSVLNRDTMPYFIVAVMLFTLSVFLGSISMRMKQQMSSRRK